MLRWRHPKLGMVSPAEFIPVAESSGLILSIGEWVLRCAVRQAKAWIECGFTPTIMAVNLSAAQFRHPDLPDLVTRILEEEGKTVLATLKPTTLLAMFNVPQLEIVARDVENTIVKIMKEAASD